jgi:Bacterial SH3 domain
MAPLFGESDKMKQMGEQMQNLSEQIGALQQQLAQKNTEISSLQEQLKQPQSAASDNGDAMKLQRAQNEIASLKQNLDMLQAQAKQAASAASASTSSVTSAAPSGTKSGAAQSGAAQSTHGLSIGGNAWVTRAGGLPLRLRSAPSLDGNILDRLAPGTQMTLLAGPQDASGHSWWQIRTTDGREGWVAGEDLRVEPD